MFKMSEKNKRLKLMGLSVVGVFLVLLTVKLILNAKNINTQTLNLMLKMDALVISDGKNQLPYRLYQPSLQNTEHKKPLVLVLQSAYRRGDNNYGQLTNLVNKFVSSEFQSLEGTYVVAPHCPENMEWNNNKPSSAPYINYDMSSLTQSWRQTLIVDLIDELIKEKNIDPQRIYITGISMGASGTWEMLYRFPNKFAGALILNGRSDPSEAQNIAQTPIKIFHGKHDEIAPITNSLEMQKAIKIVNGDIDLTILQAGHDIIEQAYDIDAFEWLLHQKLKKFKE